ncbi:MAG TPA: HDIG domain-containing protein, partial [Pyrinomonadaceae bacterium]|nr:HDIG domain-containing protein [Pyrinomonadaceae bacterium]
RAFRAAWEELQRQQQNAANANANTNSNAAKSDFRWTGQGGDEVARAIIARKFNPGDFENLTRILREAESGYVYRESDAAFFETEITIVDRQKPTQQSQLQMPQGNMTSVGDARQKLRDRIFESDNFTVEEKQVFYQALAPLVAPNVVFDEAATRAAKTVAENSIPPVQIILKRGQTIVREGDTITPQILSQLAAIRAYTSSTRQWNRFLGLIFIIAAMYWVTWKFVLYRSTLTRLILSPENTFAFIGLVILLQTALMAIGFRLAEFTAIQNLRAPFNDPSNWALAVPFASAALIITLLIDSQIGLIAGIFTAFVAGLLAPKGVEFSLFAALSSAMAVYGFERYRSRQAVTYAGLLIGGVNAGMAVALIGYTQQPFILNTILLATCCGVLGGMVAAAVTAVLLPIFESGFGILTDVKLLELSNADLPVLGQLALRAPGTNQHSHAVGQLAQEACRAIGANPLLARIGALYHDIGKLAAPDYFVENQHGTNPHDRLKPRQSAKIITAHVTYGEKLAREIGLPQRIIDFIPQHHGTRTLHYFLQKAQDAAKEGEAIDENDFRYAGPKPQSKEAAVMMIADSCEAAARSLNLPNDENVRFIVNKIVDAIVADNQLDECELSLRELTIIRESMINSLVAIYHSRVSYPGYSPPSDPPANGAPADGFASAELDSEERGVHYDSPREVPISKGGEVEDEAVNHNN